MFYINEKEFLNYLNQGIRFIVLIDGQEITIRRNMKIRIDLDDSTNQVEYTDFVIEPIKKEYKTFEEILLWLSNKGIKKDIPVIKINDFTSLEAYKEKIAFDHADMTYLLNKYADCDTFSLSRLYDGFVNNQEGDNALNSIKENNKNYLKQLYLKFKNKYNLDSFDILYSSIKKECEEFKNKYEKEYLKKFNFFSNSFICDHVGKNTKYNNPLEFFWHMYHMLGHEIDYYEQIKSQTAKLKEVDDALTNTKYSDLKNECIKTNITFQTHCTSGPLQKEYYFKLNEKTKNWLLKYKNDYEFSGELLQDLAFYKNDKLKFSSCTHEVFHNHIE